VRIAVSVLASSLVNWVTVDVVGVGFGGTARLTAYWGHRLSPSGLCGLIQ
jgi:hypothetical protein